MNKIATTILALVAVTTLIGTEEAQAAGFRSNGDRLFGRRFAPQSTNDPYRFDIDAFDAGIRGRGLNVRGAGAFSDFSESGRRFRSGILGGSRDVLLEGVGTNRLSRSRVDVSNGMLDWSNRGGMDSSLTLSWDGDDNSSNLNAIRGLGGFDLTQGDNLNYFNLGIDYTSVEGLKVTINVYTDENNYSTITQDFGAIDSLKEAVFKFDNFADVGGLGADFTNVSAIQLVLDGVTNLDARLAYFELTKAGKREIPEPTSSLLVLGGITLLGAGVKRNKV